MASHHLLDFFRGETAPAADPRDLPDGYISTPVGLVRADCVIGPDGQSAGPRPPQDLGPRLDPRTHVPMGIDGPSTRNTWAEFIYAPNNTTPLGGMNVSFRVPQPPARTKWGAPLYIFPAAQPNDSRNPSILQPVLQYGYSGNDKTSGIGGDYWIAAAWHVDEDGKHHRHSHPLRVNPGDELFTSVMSEVAKGGGRAWTVSIQKVPSGERTWLPPLTLQCDLTWLVAGAVETGADPCGFYPSSGKIEFKDIALWDTDGNTLQPEWEYLFNPVPQMCGFSGTLGPTKSNRLKMTFSLSECVADGGHDRLLPP